MAVAFTVSGVDYQGSKKYVYGTFTSAAGDTSATLNNAVHGLNFITDYDCVPAGYIGWENPKYTLSSGTLIIAVDDFLGASGTWYVRGN
ncbi:MAG: hypothetical protein KGJ89_05025 [Patescibacteria group bacterium]|nr:hypothetical protein [Patescibacteria group bacterium]MDE2227284.1 hypothetical protein [Patescibacteria group bacterium]